MIYSGFFGGVVAGKLLYLGIGSHLVKLARDRKHEFDFPQKVVFWKGNLLISGKSRLVKYCNLARSRPHPSLSNLKHYFVCESVSRILM